MRRMEVSLCESNGSTSATTPPPKESGEPNANHYDGRWVVCPRLSIGGPDGQIRENRYLDVQVAVFYVISISKFNII